MKWRAFIGGIVSGTIMSVFLKVVEELTHLRVYTLLLNVDYIPLLKRVTSNEPLELIPHLIVAIIVSVGWFVMLQKINLTKQKGRIATIMMAMCIGLLLYPSTIMSERTPSLSSFSSLGFWLLGHLVFGILLSLFYKQDE
ncbi:hypothetical protein [Priestia endophytica]|uniref:Uncharacterized protein n=1 Tax=Priestia endophytica DSM 13796 TaxID=1121089 RepID=A0A1I6BQD1_9BACI|nr:hypothetical protein [Priestia endophytica]KYG28637.1 hypothetical protein AZF06_11795 [Priestia endophytica]SFQ83142.1 hypothetical protein SAMN02745910_04005 [Priestia endophytica DSM 13796]